jgi:hypothetical protein
MLVLVLVPVRRRLLEQELEQELERRLVLVLVHHRRRVRPFRRRPCRRRRHPFFRLHP